MSLTPIVYALRKNIIAPYRNKESITEQHYSNLLEYSDKLCKKLKESFKKPLLGDIRLIITQRGSDFTFGFDEAFQYNTPIIHLIACNELETAQDFDVSIINKEEILMFAIYPGSSTIAFDIDQNGQFAQLNTEIYKAIIDAVFENENCEIAYATSYGNLSPESIKAVVETHLPYSTYFIIRKNLLPEEQLVDLINGLKSCAYSIEDKGDYYTISVTDHPFSLSCMNSSGVGIADPSAKCQEVISKAIHNIIER